MTTGLAAGMHKPKLLGVNAADAVVTAADAAEGPFVDRLRCGDGARMTTTALAAGMLISKALCCMAQPMQQWLHLQEGSAVHSMHVVMPYGATRYMCA